MSVIGTNLNRIKNKKVQTNNTSGHTGISWHKGQGRWLARISFRGKTYNIGYFDDKEEAIKARERAEKMTFDQFIENVKNATTIGIEDIQEIVNE